MVSIPQWCDCCKIIVTYAVGSECLFQSHNGAIAAVEPAEVESEEERVSIPQWCDCCN